MKVWNLDEKASPDAARTFWAGLTPGDRAEWEGRYRCKDGSTVPVEVHLRCVERDGDVRFVAIGRDIRARTETQQALEEERDLLNRILETSPAAIVVLNADGDFLEASGRAQEVLGLEKDEVTQRTFDDPDWQIRGPDGGPMPEEELPFTRVMATGEPVHDVEHQIAWPDGTRRLLSVSGAPLRSADGDLEGAVFHLDDVTERRAAEKGLREREARLRQREAQLREERDRFATLFHNLDTPVVHGRATEEGRLQVEAVNERFEATFGYEDDATRGADLQGLIVPPHEEESAALMRRQLLQGVAVDREVQRRAVDGLRDFRVQVALRRDDDGRPTEGFAIYTDITERRNRERRLARRRALLAAQAEASLDGLLVVNADREVSFHNERFCEIWRLPTPLEASGGEAVSAEAVLLDAVADLLPDPEIFRTEVEYLYDHPHEESRTLVQLTDGRWLDRYSAPVVGDDGHPFGRLWVFRDVTRQRQMLEQLLEVQEEERRRIDQEIHDEMGGLLTSLQLTIDLARRDVQQGGDALASFDQLEGLVSELSSVSRTISRKLFPSDLSEKGLREGLATLVEEVQADHALSVELYSEIGPDDPVPLLVERTVYWIVQEALLNVARHATADATQVILNKRGKQLYLHIFDEGAGVSQAAQERGRSLQVDAIRRRVEWLNGEVRIDSIPDEGVRLSVVLPLRLPYLIGGGGAGAEPGGNSPADPAV
jgi:PAS domain S-box-containing protein